MRKTIDAFLEGKEIAVAGASTKKCGLNEGDKITLSRKRAI
ncbi:MAG: hypothetical protein WD577_02965 [Bacteroidales bacterium]